MGSGAFRLSSFFFRDASGHVVDLFEALPRGKLPPPEPPSQLPPQQPSQPSYLALPPEVHAVGQLLPTVNTDVQSHDGVGEVPISESWPVRLWFSSTPLLEWCAESRMDLLAPSFTFGSPSRATLSSNYLLHGHPPEPRCVELDTMRSAKSGGGTGLGACPPSLDPAQLSLGLISQPAGWIRSTPSEPNPHTCAADRTDRQLPRLWVRTSRSWLLLMKPREGGMPTSGGWVLPGCQRDKLLPACMLPAATDTTETPPAEMGACSLPSLANTGGTPRSTIPTKKLASFSVRAAIVQS